MLLLVYAISFVSVLIFPGNHLSITDLKSEENVRFRLEDEGGFITLGNVCDVLFDIVMLALTVEVDDWLVALVFAYEFVTFDGVFTCNSNFGEF